MTYLPVLQKNFVDTLHQHMLAKPEVEAGNPDRAFIEVVLDYMGYDDTPDFRADCISDGKGDFGIDAWFISDEAATVFQFKSVDFSEEVDINHEVPPSGLADLYRIFSLIKSPDKPPQEANPKVRAFLQKFRSVIHRQTVDTVNPAKPYRVLVNFVALAKGLTKQAIEEYRQITENHAFQINEVPVEVQYRKLFIDDLIAERWRETNADWRDRNGIKRDEVDLTVVGEQILEEPKSLVFFTKAHDLVRMFEDFGYQVFEPNVRCEIKKSKVNDAIQGSVQSHRGREEFRHLNNGITVIAAGFRKVGKPIKRVSVRQPGVINGLQTIKSIYDAFNTLKTDEQKHLIENCTVLIRLHARNAVSDYRSLVKSTNNQNPMQQRNLRANDPEQIKFEQLFANFEWFYERKEGAWSAFKSDAKLWGTLRNKKPTDFLAQPKLVRSVDNEDLAQTWLAFLGFSNEAVHERSRIFSEPDIYDLVFLKRTGKHGCEYGFKLDLPRVIPDAIDDAPDPRLMLVSYLCREFARQVVSAPKTIRDEAVKRLGVQNMIKEKQNDKLNEDTKYVEGLIIRALSYVFPELVGYCLFKAFGREAHTKGAKLLANGTLKRLATTPDFKSIRDQIAEKSWRLDEEDVLQVMWHLFSECVSKLIASGWRQQWMIAPNRTRFNYRPSTRELLFKELDQLDDYLSEVELTRKWAIGINKSKGIYKFVERALG